MVTVFLVMSIGIVLGIIQVKHDLWYSISTVGRFLSYLGGIVIGALIGFVAGCGIAIMLPMDTYDKHSTLTIVSLQDNGGMSGEFFLGYGHLDGKMQYVFYHEKNGMYEMLQVPYTAVQIKYTDSIPKVNVTENYPTEAFINYFAGDLDIHDKTYIIEVPRGTIQNDYILDAK